MIAANKLTLAKTFGAGSQTGNLVKNIGLMVVGSLLLAASAHIKIPFFPVPMTMQLFVVLAIGAAYGSRLGLSTVLLYLAQGALGFPVFAGGAGLVYMMGPTGGYLIGFAVAAFIVGSLAERGWDRNYLTTAAAMAIGVIAMYALGLAWLAAPVTALAATAGSGFQGIGLEAAITHGLMPFILGDLLKIALATLLFPTIWKSLNKRS